MKRNQRLPSKIELENLSTLFNQGLAAEAEKLAIDLTSRFPAHGFAWKVLSVIQLESMRFSEALQSAIKAVKLLPSDAAVHNNLGNIYLRLERREEAEPCFRDALRIAPNYSKALFNLSSLMRHSGKLNESEKYCRQALAATPDYTNAHIGLGNALELQNKLSDARVSYKNALTLAPDMANLHTDVLHLLSLDVSVNPQQLFSEHVAFGAHFEAPFLGRYPTHQNTKDPERHLQIGFITADMNNHALANFLEPLFAFLVQKPKLTLHIYYTKGLEDSVTQRFKVLLPCWNQVTDLSEDELVARIQGDAIDILFDLGGHTVLNRLTTFARKPAPIQASWLGYLGTTGLQAMDYYVCDPFWLPPGELDWQFSEKLAYLPSAMVFLPNASAPPINELPALASKRVTFGSFNRFNKINDSVIALWSLLLRAVPNSRMALCAVPKEFEDDTVARFAHEGIERERLTFLPRTSQIDYLALHHQVDFCLDTFPHGGGATIAHAAWMGVPTLCLSGESPASRFGATEMHHLGLDVFIAQSIDEFVEKGCFWANQVNALSELRQTMRTRFQESALGQYRSFADNFDALLRAMWARWCSGLPAAPIQVEAQCLQADTTHSVVLLEPSPRDLDTLSRLYQQQKYDLVEPVARQLANQYPDHGLAWKILGSTLHQLGRLKESLDVQIRITQLRPNDHEAHFNLACEYQQQGQFDDAVRSYIQSLGLRPDNANAYLNLSSILKTMGLATESEMYARQAIALQPDMATAHNNLGNALHGQGRFFEAESSYRRSLELRPNCADTFNNLAITLKDQGYWQQANDAFRRALEIKPEWAAARSNLLYCMSHDVQIEPQVLHAEHVAFGDIFEAPLRADWIEHPNDKAPDRVLRVGFVSADLYDHAMANFLEPVFEGLSKSKGLVMHAYYTHVIEDNVTCRMQRHFAGWHKVANLSQSELASQIRADHIDILVDLAGHTAYNRLLTFALKPAPIQVSWLGYLGTTGLKGMDYYLCDKFWVPPGELDWQFSEKMAYVPTAVCFLPNENSPAVNTLPAIGNGYITFGSFNRPNKLNASVIVLWSMLLKSVPNARMILAGIPPDSEQTLRALFAQEQIDQERLAFYPRTNLLSYLSLHHEVDLCLDSFPYGGGATTANAAWMGIPTLSLAGDTPPSRFGSAMTHQLSLDGFIALDIDDFVNKGCYWSAHLSELSHIRQELRERFAASPLGKSDQYATHFEALFRLMWTRWCNGVPVTAIDLNGSDTQTDFNLASSPSEPDAQMLDTLVDLYNTQQYTEATALVDQLLLSFPEHGLLWKTRASIHQNLGNYEASLPAVRQAILLQPDDATNYNNLGVALLALDRLDEAEESFKMAIELAPSYGKALVNLGAVMQLQDRPAEAQISCTKAIEIDPSDAAAYIGLGKALESQGMVSEAQASYYRADMAHEPRRAVAHSNVMYLLNHDVLVNPQHLYREHAAFGEVFEAPLRAHWTAHNNLRDTTRVLKVGFVSGDFHHHALNEFVEPAFKALAVRPGLSLWAYSAGTREDEVTQRMRSFFGNWRDISNLTDEDLSNQIRKDGIDILIDLSGHTAKNRLLAFARKPAPVQISWLGYLGTTGLQAMDYYLCDEYWIPSGKLDWQFTEKMAYLPNAVVFQPSSLAPEINALPALRNGYITFGSFNRVTKINDSVIALWSMVMQKAPDSVLLFAGIDASSQPTITSQFHEQGIEASRLSFYPRLATADYLSLHHQVDICLDTFPHGGGATTAHAAWMGVPTLCLAGETPASRFSATLMHHLGLDDFVAESVEAFVELGVMWAGRIEELSTLRGSMRQQFKKSTLDRPEQFAKSMETTLRTVWKHWCENSALMLTSPRQPVSLNVENLGIAKDTLVKALFKLAQDNESSGNSVAAACLYVEALRLTPEDAQINYRLGLIEMTLKGAVEALPRFETVVQLQPNEEAHWVAYIDALIRTGAIETAASALEWGQKYGLSTTTAEKIAANCVAELEKRINPHQIDAACAYTKEEMEWPTAPEWPIVDPSLIVNLDYIRQPNTSCRRYVIFAPPYRHNSAGIRVMYELQKWLILAGYDAIVIATIYGCDVKQFADDIVIYPEVVTGNPLKVKRVVRYILNVPGKLGGTVDYAPHELLVAYNDLLAEHANGKVLNLPFIEPFFCQTNAPKCKLAVYVGKGTDLKLHPQECIYITRDFPETRREIAALLQEVSTFYIYDNFSAIAAEALLCGCKVKVIQKNGKITDLSESILNSVMTATHAFKAKFHDFIEATKLL